MLSDSAIIVFRVEKSLGEHLLLILPGWDDMIMTKIKASIVFWLISPDSMFYLARALC